MRLDEHGDHVLISIVLPGDDMPMIVTTVEQLGEAIEASQWQQGDPTILIVADAGYDLIRLPFVLADLPIEVVGRIRSDRVTLRPAPPRRPSVIRLPAKHGGVFTLAAPNSWRAPDTTRYRHVQALAWELSASRETVTTVDG